MADPRANVASLRSLGLEPPRPAPVPEPTAASKGTPEQEPPPETARERRARPRGERRPPSSDRRPQSERERTDPASDRRGHDDQRRSRSTSLYLDATARRRLKELRRANQSVTIADAVVSAVRAQLAVLRATHQVAPVDPEDPFPPAPRRRPRRDVDDARPVQVRLTTRELEVLSGLAEDLGLSVSRLVSVALATLPSQPVDNQGL